MPTRINDVLNIPRESHSHYDFANVRLAPDTKVFLDPCLIASAFSEWAICANTTIESYFDSFYALFCDNASDEQKLTLFGHAHEINATHLGYGNGHNGKAKTPYGMLDTFRGIPKLIQNGISLSKASDLPLFIKDFAEDCLSDMLTNILLKDLMQFTLEQCRRYHVNTVTAPRGLYYWDINTNHWEEYSGYCLMYEGKVLLLVPKKAIRNRYYFTANQYFSRIILSRMQEDTEWRDKNGTVKRLPKKELKKRELQNGSTLSAIKRLTSSNPSYLREYHEKLPSFYTDKGMSDEMLDNVIYG